MHYSRLPKFSAEKSGRTRTLRGGRSLFQSGLRLKFNRIGSQAS